MARLTIDRVSKSFEAFRALADVSLEVADGELMAVLGASGCGKTTLLRQIAGFDRVDSGRILIGDTVVSSESYHMPPEQRRIGIVFQSYALWPHMTVAENVAYGLTVAGVKEPERTRRVHAALTLVELDGFGERKPALLSGGQRQRVALARCLVTEPSLVLLDEPLANLDYKLREELREELPRIFAASGAIFVYATTDPAEALLLGGNTATLFKGRITQFGPTAQVYRRPDDLVTAHVFSDPPLNTIAGFKSGLMVTLDTGVNMRATGAFATVPDGRYTVAFRAHHLALEPPVEDPIAIPAVVSVAEITGSESFIHLDAGEHRFVAQVPGVRRLEPGSAVTIYPDPKHLFVFDEAGRLRAAELARVA